MARFDKLELIPPDDDEHEGVLPAPRRQDEVSWTREADAARRSGHYENALRYYSRALELDRSLIGCWLGQLQMLVLLDEAPEAETWSRKALELFPNNGELLAGRAQALCRMGESKAAHGVCDAAINSPGQSAYRWLVRGELMLNARQDVDRHCFDKAVQIDGDWLVRVEIAMVYLHYHVPTKALLRLREAAEQNPEQPYIWYLMGCAQERMGMDGPATRSFARCLELRPDHQDARRRMDRPETVSRSLTQLFRRWFGSR